MRNRHLYITLLTLLGFSAEAVAQALAQTPQLVVTITIDQLRTDYMEAYAPLYQSAGLKRLLNEGMVFPNGSCDFTPVDRASATASMATGSTPYYNGIPGLVWLNRSTLRPQNIAEDPKDGHAPLQLATSTISDELKIATGGQGKVFAFATDAERAILSAGHAADGAVWVSGSKWNIAPYYTPENQWLSWYTRQYKPVEDINKSVTEIAIKCVEQSGITQNEKPSMLFVSYTVNPDEMSYKMLDYYIALLVGGIQHKMPKDRVLFVLTGTGVTTKDSEGENASYRIPTGKFYINRTANLLNMYLGAIHGAAQYVETSFQNQIFLNRKLIDKKNLNMGDLLRQAQEFLLQIAGVRNVYTSNQLMTSDSQMLQRIRNGFNVEKSGDLLIDVAPGWELINEDMQTTSTSRINSIPFPIIFFGAGIKAGRVLTPVTVDRIAPTVARAIRIRAPNACSAEPLF
ncbi:MAG: alkaline phosphatase family protein [Prevotella sp.]|nr:alkaline phosphatase family protein [Prevotella sp.]MBQ9654482.1 alkaline phosphatase family protein [Prevotella sp.]MBR1505937.1 alkaline phosphatase family protein [Prevotella sp.]